MASIIQRAVEKMRGLLLAETGLSVSLAKLEESPYPEAVSPEQFVLGAVGSEMLERRGKVRYPLFVVYCDRLTRDTTAKFGRLSDVLRVVIEIRLSQDRLDGLQERLLRAVDAVTDVLDQNEGCLDEEVYLSGKREIQVEPTKQGGQNYLQSAKVMTELIWSRI
jgi:hypothetical protein